MTPCDIIYRSEFLLKTIKHSISRCIVTLTCKFFFLSKDINNLINLHLNTFNFFVHQFIIHGVCMQWNYGVFFVADFFVFVSWRNWWLHFECEKKKYFWCSGHFFVIRKLCLLCLLPITKIKWSNRFSMYALTSMLRSVVTLPIWMMCSLLISRVWM